MIVYCPHCGEPVEVCGLGRKKLNIPLNNILESLERQGSVVAAARQLHCSPGYIHNVLKAAGLKSKDVIAAGKGRGALVNTARKGVIA